MGEEKDKFKLIAHLKTIRKIDRINEGLLTLILAFLIGFIGLLLTIGFGLIPFVFSEAYFIEHGMCGDRFYGFMGTLEEFSSLGFSILLLMFTIRCFVKPLYLVLSKRRGV